MGTWIAACSQYSHSSSHTLVPHDVLELPGASPDAGEANMCIGPVGKRRKIAGLFTVTHNSHSTTRGPLLNGMRVGTDDPLFRDRSGARGGAPGAGGGAERVTGVR